MFSVSICFVKHSISFPKKKKKKKFETDAYYDQKNEAHSLILNFVSMGTHLIYYTIHLTVSIGHQSEIKHSLNHSGMEGLKGNITIKVQVTVMLGYFISCLVLARCIAYSSDSYQKTSGATSGGVGYFGCCRRLITVICWHCSRWCLHAHEMLSKCGNRPSEDECDGKRQC